MSISDSEQSNENSKQTEKQYKSEPSFKIRWERQFTPKKQHPFYRRKLTEAEKLRRKQENDDRIAEMRQRLKY